MHKKFKIVFKYTLLFILSIILLVLIGLILLKITVFKPSYVINRLDKMDYYHALETDIKTEMSYYTNQSGFEDDILDDTFTIDELREMMNTYINNLYHGKKTTVDASKFKKRLNSKIDDYLYSKDFKVTNRDDIDKFVSEMVKIYKSEIKIIDYFESLSPDLIKLIDYANKVLIILAITFVILLLIGIFAFKINNLNVILFTNSFLLISVVIFIKSKIAVNNLFVYSELLSKIIIDITNNLLKYTIIIAIICFILGILYGLFRRNKRRS